MISILGWSVNVNKISQKHLSFFFAASLYHQPKESSSTCSIPQVWPHQLCAIHAVLWWQWKEMTGDRHGKVLWMIKQIMDSRTLQLTICLTISWESNSGHVQEIIKQVWLPFFCSLRIQEDWDGYQLHRRQISLYLSIMWKHSNCCSVIVKLYLHCLWCVVTSREFPAQSFVNWLMLYQPTAKFGLDEINEIRASENPPTNLPWNHLGHTTNETYTQIHFLEIYIIEKQMHFWSLGDFSSRNHDSWYQIWSMPVRFDERRGIICRMLEFIFAEAWLKCNVVNYCWWKKSG